MNIKQAKTEEIALILHALRAVFVADQEKVRAKLMKQCEDELAERGVSLKAD